MKIPLPRGRVLEITVIPPPKPSELPKPFVYELLPNEDGTWRLARDGYPFMFDPMSKPQAMLVAMDYVCRHDRPVVLRIFDEGGRPVEERMIMPGS